MVETICIMVAGDNLLPPGTSYNSISQQKKKSTRKASKNSKQFEQQLTFLMM